ncbi:MAG: T9SS type A sorting domain-containing protein [Bacteroidetes bacterium]|nr:T9SS type A sorting domain-containing protein [Bacteroidota bacterium]
MKNLVNFYLKTTLVIMMAFSLANVIAQNSKISYDNNWGKQGISVKKQSQNGITINSSIESYYVAPIIIDNNSLQTITTEGVYLQNDAGAPNLPAFSNYIAIPQGASVTAKIVKKQMEIVNNIAISPAPVIPKDDDNTPLIYIKNPKIFTTNANYPENIVQVSEPMKIRGMDVVIVGVSPFQYNPITQQLIINRDIEIEITFEGGNSKFGDDRLRNRWWDPIIKDAVLNSESISTPNQNQRSGRETGYEYLIIVPEDATFIAWADSIRNFRVNQGISTNVLTTTEVGGNNISAIESYINNAYNTWDIPPAAVLLMADYGDVGNTIISPIYNNYCASDNIFADVDGDHMPDVIFARMTAQTEEHLETFVTKVLNYERTPPTDPNFYNHPITALGWQTERWFQICSETVGGYFSSVQGKEPVRINAVYIGNPDVDPWSSAQNTNTIMQYFGPDGLGYIPATPAELGGWSGGTSADVNNALNNGAFILQHRDHGNSTGWGEPSYTSSSINGLTNTDLSFIFSINCLTGKFNNTAECFAEKFHRYKYDGENSGALGLIAASETSYSFVNDTYVWGMYDNMWPDFLPDYGANPEPRGILPAFGNAAGKYFLQQSSWPYNTNNKEVTYNLFHHHGDAFSVIYSEVPQYLTVTHEQSVIAGEISFTVTADENSFIALSVNNELIGTAEGTGSPVVIEIAAQYPPNKLLVTVTKQNYYRYESLVDIDPPEGPYVIYNEVAINNSTGMMTTGESTLADLTVKNIGIEIGENIQVTVSSTDQYIEFTDNTENYGSIEAGATSTVAEGYAWNVANDIPDMYLVPFDVESTDGNDIWLSKMNIIAHAPKLSIGSMTFNDDQFGNGDGQLDPGETLDVTIKVYNEGSVIAPLTVGNFISLNPFIEVVNSQYAIGNIESGNMLNALFTITVADETPIGSLVDFEFEAVSGEYNAEKTFSNKVGLIVEDWETGDMTKYPWQTGGSSVWEISTSNPYEGAFCNKSSDLSDQQSTWMSLIYESSIDDSISFYVMVSSEDQYDFFRFYIDGMPKITLSGEESWQRISLPISAGTHLYKWQYSKDVNQSAGEDCARVDYIILPAPPITSAFAGSDKEFCDMDEMPCEGTATYCESVLWTTSGSGTFSDPEIFTPLYVPSDDDMLEGSVELTFTGFGPIETVEDKVIFSFALSPNIDVGENSIICSSESFLLADANAVNYNTLSWTTLGDGTFDNENAINPVYTPGITDIENGVTSLILTAMGSEACGEIVDQLELTINTAPVANAGIDADICPMLTYTIEDALVLNYEQILWTTNGDGSFDDPTTIQPTYTPGNIDITTKEVTLTLTTSNGLFCPESVDDMMLTLLCTDVTELVGHGVLSLYPNPNGGSFTLKIENVISEIATIKIYNSVGKVVYEKSNIQMNNAFNMIFSLETVPGIYTIVVEGNNTHLTKKFIIK